MLTLNAFNRSMDINDRKQKSGKSKLKSAEGRKNLSNVRVIQRKLVYVVGMPATVADEEVQIVYFSLNVFKAQGF